MKRCLLSLLAILLLCCAIARACQYTVRDIGFVNLRGPEYTLVVRAPRELEGKLGDWSYLSDTNLRLLNEWSSVEEANEVQQCRVFLRGTQGSELEIGQFEAEFSSVADRVYERLFETPAMRELRQRALTSFAQLIILESNDSGENERVRMAVSEAIKAIKRIEPMLPRPLARPVVVQTLPHESLASEPLLTWSLGGVANTDQATRVAVMYGRGKLAGQVLAGNQISLRGLLGQLALIGESCECETDRSWSEELVLPMHWPAEFRSQAAATLGFDPDSPLVQAEISRIISRGPSQTRQPGSRSGDGIDDIEQLLLGYEEQQFAPYQGSDSGEPNSQNQDGNGAADDSFSVVLQSGDGWGFAEPEPTVPPANEAENATEETGESDDSHDSQMLSRDDAVAGSFRMLAMVLTAMAGGFVVFGFLVWWLLR